MHGVVDIDPVKWITRGQVGNTPLDPLLKCALINMEVYSGMRAKGIGTIQFLDAFHRVPCLAKPTATDQAERLIHQNLDIGCRQFALGRHFGSSSFVRDIPTAMAQRDPATQLEGPSNRGRLRGCSRGGTTSAVWMYQSRSRCSRSPRTVA